MAWLNRWLEDCRRDGRHTVRTLVRTPTFTLTAVLSLALGIGANAAIFSLVDQVLLRLLPVRDPHSIVLIDWRGNALADGWGSGNLMSYPMCRDLQAQTQFFDGVLCRHPTTVNLSSGGEHQPVLAEIVSGTYFPVLGVRPHLGRLIAESDDLVRDAHPVVVIAHDYWANTLGRAPDIVGRKVLVNNQPMTVIGVAEPGFSGIDVGEAAALWVPAMMKRQVTPGWDRLFDRRARWMHVFGRLKPGVTRGVRQGRTPAVVQVGARVRSAARGFSEDDARAAAILPRVLSRRDAGLAWAIEHAAGDGRAALGSAGRYVTAGAARVLERREPAPCAWRRARTRAGHAHRARRVSRPDHESAADRRHRDFARRRTAWHRRRAGGLRRAAVLPATGRRAREPDLRSRHARPAVHIPCLHRNRRAVRQCTRAAGRKAVARHGAPRAVAEHWRRPSPPCAGHRPDRLHAHPSYLRGSLSADGLPPARKGTGVVRERSPSDVSGRHSEERIYGSGGCEARAQAAGRPFAIRQASPARQSPGTRCSPAEAGTRT